MRYYLIAGEASGDLHGANLIRGIRRADPQAEFRFWGGDKMSDAAGAANLVKHYRETSFMGFWEVLTHLRTILSQLSECQRDVAAYAPDVLILIDYPGFNLRMARYAKERGIPTFYYIAPKVWAWKESRVKLIRRYVDRLFIIFPFEKKYFADRGIEAFYGGNPLVDDIVQKKAQVQSIEEFRREWQLDARPIVALLAGSRKSEIKFNFPFMVEVSQHFPQFQFVVAGVPWIDKALYEKYMAGTDVKYACDSTFQLIHHAEAAIVTSGTATLETALIGTPEFICYQFGRISAFVARKLVKIRYVSLVNIVMNREVVKELLLDKMTQENAQRELSAVLPGGAKRDKMLQEYAMLRSEIGGAGASDRFGAEMVRILNEEIKR